MKFDEQLVKKVKKLLTPALLLVILKARLKRNSTE